MNDDAKFIESLERAVAEKGRDYVYSGSTIESDDETCLYIEGGKPSCLIGHALVYTGVPVEFFEGHEGDGADTVMEFVQQNLGLEFSNELILAAVVAQLAQDAGREWGTALDRFYETIKDENEGYAL